MASASRIAARQAQAMEEQAAVVAALATQLAEALERLERLETKVDQLLAPAAAKPSRATKSK